MRSIDRGTSALAAAELFFPLDRELDLGTEGYSPSLLARIEYAGGNAPSFGQGSEMLKRLADLCISAKHVQRLTERVGHEREVERDAAVERLRAGTLTARHGEPPRVVAVHVDGGKLQMRADDGAPGVRDPHWGDTKVACLVSYTAPQITQDPQPEPPKAFLDPAHVDRLCAEMEHVRNAPAPMPPRAPLPATEEATASAPRPRVLVKTTVATRGNTDAFGWLVAAEAMRRGFYQAGRGAVVGDGGNWIEPLGAKHFPGFTQVLDFLHLLVHLYAVAVVATARDGAKAWVLYERMLRAAWSGRVGDVLLELEALRTRLGPIEEKDPHGHPRRVVERTLEYVRTNAKRMDYPRYRQEGLPISSALIESLIKQFNQRVKGSEKFWVDSRAEAVLQVRAAYLNQDDRALEIYRGRGARARAVGGGRLRAVA